MWQKMAVLAAVALPVIGCAGGVAGVGSQPPVSSPAPAVTTQSGQSNIFGSVARDFTLVSIDDHALPYALPNASDVALPPTEVMAGTLRLEPNGAFSIATTYREAKSPDRRGFDTKATGLCAPDEDGYHMYWDGGGDSQLVISGDTVRVNNSGVIFRYIKRG